MLIWRMPGLAAVTMLAIACAGDSDDEDAVLHLGGLDITVADYRTYLREVFAQLGDNVCGGENLEFLRTRREAPPDMWLPGYGTDRPSQLGDADSNQTALDLIEEECQTWLDKTKPAERSRQGSAEVD